MEPLRGLSDDTASEILWILWLKLLKDPSSKPSSNLAKVALRVALWVRQVDQVRKNSRVSKGALWASKAAWCKTEAL
jgi:hypothetical protein